jgi:hypothetical protein
VFSK